MAKIHNIKDFQPSFNDIFFFDNNIWIYLFYPLANFKKSKQATYSNFLAKIKNKNAAVFTNSMVLSEFSNYWLQTEFKKWKKDKQANVDYKRDFIKTHEFQKSVNDLKIALGNILKTSEKANDDFNAVSIENIFGEFGKCDFNDSYYIELARLRGWKVVTEDADFFKNNNLNIEIITDNI
ncbi:MAG TPA: type II toxin-antitoxin system VapC family toxin [Bacteroidales bacterium]|nr:type II toxin-antitoxin system VapC family toxin [Bacteroidales bacterium]